MAVVLVIHQWWSVEQLWGSRFRQFRPSSRPLRRKLPISARTGHRRRSSVDFLLDNLRPANQVESNRIESNRIESSEVDGDNKRKTAKK